MVGGSIFVQSPAMRWTQSHIEDGKHWVRPYITFDGVPDGWLTLVNVGQANRHPYVRQIMYLNIYQTDRPAFSLFLLEICA